MVERANALVPGASNGKHKYDEKESLLADIERTRAEMSETVIAIEERLSPGHMKEQLLEQFHEVKDVIKRELTEELKDAKQALGEQLKSQIAEAKVLVSGELKEQLETAKETVIANFDEAKDHVKRELKEQIEVAKETVKENFEDVKDAVKREIHEAKAAVREATIGRVENMVHSAEATVKSAGRTVTDTIRENPIPAAMIGIGLGWLIMNRRRRTEISAHGQFSSSEESHGAGAALHKVEAYGADIVHKVKDTASELGSKVKHASSSLADSVQHTASQLKDKTTHLAGDAQQAVGKMAHQVKDTMGEWSEDAKQMEQKFEGSVKANPLAYGAIALAVGTAVGLSLPHTEIEDEYLGTASDKVMQKAEQVAHETLESLQQGGRRNQNA